MNTAPKMPKMKKGPRIKPKRPFGLHAAFAAGGNRAFNDPSSMAAPNQAFSPAMAPPQGGAPDASPMPTLPAGQ